ncbi:aspartyl-phosphate phosphatase Spo0E family protein [Bacillus sp. OTU530]|uniref:aspartyl-phosphate phosphatase Spo0E family protein n=1 Tax=Bacillus sp. OTU530 TaxID=3043862 RepID=UPI00313ABEE6
MFSLTNLIETKREQLFYLGKLYGLTHPKTIQCSQQLDVLINASFKKEKHKGKITGKYLKRYIFIERCIFFCIP